MILLCLDDALALKPTITKADSSSNLKNSQNKRLKMAGGFGGSERSEIPKPKIITPSRGKLNSNLEKFLMMYTCKICDGRNAQMVSKWSVNEKMFWALSSKDFPVRDKFFMITYAERQQL